MGVGSLPDHHPLSVWQVLSHPSPTVLAEPRRAVCDVLPGCAVEPLTLDCGIHPEALSKKLVAVQLAQGLWPALPFPGEVHAIRPRRLWLLANEALQGGDNLQRGFRPELLPFRRDDALFFLRRRPMQLAASKPMQRFC